MFVDYNEFHGTDGDDTNWYGEFSPRLSFGKLFRKDLPHTFFRRSLFEIKDVLLAAQYERGEDADEEFDTDQAAVSLLLKCHL